MGQSHSEAKGAVKEQRCCSQRGGERAARRAPLQRDGVLCFTQQGKAGSASKSKSSSENKSMDAASSLLLSFQTVFQGVRNETFSAGKKSLEGEFHQLPEG